MTTPPTPGHAEEGAAVAVVTGSGRGIGAAIATRLAADGYRVIGLDLGDQSDTAREIEQRHGIFRAVTCDVTHAAEVERVVAEIESDLGPIEVLVNNAAIDDAISFDELDIDRWRRVIAVDLEAPFLLMKAIVPGMRTTGRGRIVNVASGSVVNPMPGFVAYRAAKMGLIGLTRAMAIELGRDGITVNAVSPGVVATAMSQGSLTPEFLAATIARQGVKRSGEPDDIAAMISYLCSPQASFVTGQTLMVNGGAAFT